MSKCYSCGNVVSYNTAHACLNDKRQIINRVGPASARFTPLRKPEREIQPYEPKR